MRTYIATLIIGLCCFCAGPHRLLSATVKATEEARRWVDAKFLAQAKAITDHGYLLVYAKQGGIDRNAVDEKPLRIGSRQFHGGIHFSAGKVVVHVPRTARSFEAVLGADGNRDDMGYGGRGSFVLSVEAQGRELYHSEVMQEGMAGVPIRVDLGGSKEFSLQLKPVGPRKPWDSAEWDQADWAEARVTLDDGSTIALADLHAGPPPTPYLAEPPFSFRYGGRPSGEMLKTWEFNRSERRLDSNRTEYVLTHFDPRTGLLVRCVAIAYADFPTVEWTVYFRNEGTENTPILEQVQALDTPFERRPEGEFILHHTQGSQTSPTDFQPLEARLEPRADERIVAGSGRTTSKQFSYFNVEWPGQGIIVGLGWPGDWAAQFTRDEGTVLRVRSGQ